MRLIQGGEADVSQANRSVTLSDTPCTQGPRLYYVYIRKAITWIGWNLQVAVCECCGLWCMVIDGYNVMDLMKTVITDRILWKSSMINHKYNLGSSWHMPFPLWWIYCSDSAQATELWPISTEFRHKRFRDHFISPTNSVKSTSNPRLTAGLCVPSAALGRQHLSFIPGKKTRKVNVQRLNSWNSWAYTF